MDIGESEEAERAFTSVVEVLPAEAESHKSLAELRRGAGSLGRGDRAVGASHKSALLSPTGLLGLAAAQIHQSRWADAKATIVKLRQTKWPERFGDVDDQIIGLEQE